MVLEWHFGCGTYTAACYTCRCTSQPEGEQIWDVLADIMYDQESRNAVSLRSDMEPWNIQYWR